MEDTVRLTITTIKIDWDYDLFGNPCDCPWISGAHLRSDINPLAPEKCDGVDNGL